MRYILFLALASICACNQKDSPTKQHDESQIIKQPEDLKSVLQKINHALTNWPSNELELSEPIKSLEQIFQPYSIQDSDLKKIILDQSLLIKLAYLNNKNIITQIAEQAQVALDIIILIDSLVDKANLGDYDKSIKEIHEKLLIYPHIKKAYYKMLSEKADVDLVLKIYAKSSPFDNKIYNTSVYDPNDYVTLPVKWDLKSRGRTIKFTQLPVLNQQNTLEDPTDYCGYYALFNASLLPNSDLNKLQNREKFTNLFHKLLIDTKNERIDISTTDLMPSDLLHISKLDYSELINLATKHKINIENFDLDSSFMNSLKSIDEGIYLPKIIEHFLKNNSLKQNTEKQIFIGNTSLSGSHWIAFSIEIKLGIVFVTIADSLSKNRESWVRSEP